VFLKKYIVVAAFLLPSISMAGETAMQDENLLQPIFKFQQQTINLGTGNNITSGEAESLAGSNQLFDRENTAQGQITQYDAVFAYPFGKPGNTVNFDLGVNIRFINAGFRNQDVDQTRRLNMTLPMFHATAFFNIPNSGLSASLGGRYIDYDQYRASDYKAKLSYSWQNGFGLEGGWQHQQFSIDGSDYHTEFEVKGPFLDLKYRF